MKLISTIKKSEKVCGWTNNTNFKIKLTLSDKTTKILNEKESFSTNPDNPIVRREFLINLIHN
jgi:hypothetical protein